MLNIATETRNTDSKTAMNTRINTDHFLIGSPQGRLGGRFFVSGFAVGWIVVIFMALAGLRAGATVIVNESFSDGERVLQNPPDSLHWYTSTASQKATVTDGALNITGKGGVMAYFNPVQLQVGDSLSLSFNYSYTDALATENSLMFGLYDSGGSYQTKDAVGFNNKIFENYTGYATSGVLGADTSATGLDHIEARDQTGHNLLSLDTYTVGSSAKQSGGATPGEIYAAAMRITRTAEGITVESKVGNTEMVQTYTSEMFAKFDSAGIFSNGNSGTFSIDNVKIDYAGAPEPSTFIAIAAFGLAVFSRSLGARSRELLRKLVPQGTWL